MAICERSLRPDHPDLVWTLGPYALFLLNNGDVEGARATLDRALQIAENAYGKRHVGVARTLQLFGFHHYQKAEFDEALRWYRSALEILEENFGVGHRSTAWNLYDQACILAIMSEHDAALATLQRMLETGWANSRIFEDDDLDSLRGDPEFEAMLEEVRGRL